MAAWRKRAEALLPELRHEFAEDAPLTVYQAFFSVLPFVRAAHKREDEDALRRGYAFAQWCWHQGRSPDLQNAAAVAFYEHLFDDWSIRAAVPCWLEPSIRESIVPLWEARLSPEQMDEVRQLLTSPAAERWRELKPLIRD